MIQSAIWKGVGTALSASSINECVINPGISKQTFKITKHGARRNHPE